MARGREKSAFGEIRALGSRARFPEFHLHTLAITYVADRGHDQRIDAIGDRTQADFHREFRAVLPRREQIEPGSHRSTPPARSVLLTMHHMSGVKSARWENLCSLVDEIRSVVAK